MSLSSEEVQISNKKYLKTGRVLKHTIKSARKRLGITQRELAEKLSVSPSAIGMYEQGRREPNCRTLTEICSVLKIPSQEFFQKSDVFNANSVLNGLIEYLNSEKEVALNGEILSKQKKDNIAYILNLILKDK